MNAKQKIMMAIGVPSLATWTAMSGPVIVVQPPAPPAVVVQVPAPAPPAVKVEVGVPDTYVWDGDEYVGVAGDQYYYLGPGNVWLVCDPVRLARFHAWEKAHADWRAHATVNVKFRLDAQGHNHPRHDNHGH